PRNSPPAGACTRAPGCARSCREASRDATRRRRRSGSRRQRARRRTGRPAPRCRRRIGGVHDSSLQSTLRIRCGCGKVQLRRAGLDGAAAGGPPGGTMHVPTITRRMAAIEVRGLERAFQGGVKAVRGVDLEVSEGEIYAFLGPNGAGKTTTVRMLTTLLRPTGGSARVAGHDIVHEAAAV